MNGLGRLDLKQLKVLDAALRERNLSRVASQMGLTQQAISEQLRKLREVFGDRLFIRQGNRMVPTPRALELGARAGQILRDVEALLEPEHFDPATYEGVFSLSATDYALQAILPDLLRDIRQEAPRLRMVVSHFKSDRVEEQLRSGELDLALAFPEFVPQTLSTMMLFEDRHICVASACSPRLGRRYTIEEIAALPQLVISPSRANLKGSHDNWFANMGLARHIVMSVPSFTAAPDVLYTTDMIAFYPERLLPNDKVRPLQMDAAPPPFHVIAAWHPRTAGSAVHRWILQKLAGPAGRATESPT